MHVAHAESRHTCVEINAHRYIQREVRIPFHLNTVAVKQCGIHRLHNAALDLLELLDLDIYMKSVSAHLT